MEERLQKILAKAGYGSRRSCEELITKGTNINAKLSGISYTALQYAISEGQIEIGKLLVENGADVNIRSALLAVCRRTSFQGK